jgi:hypothetical protein
MPNERRRRTERLFLRYPVKVEGFDSSGSQFGETTHTIVVNRHGGRVLVKAALTPGQTVRVTQVVSGRAADFRVVGLAGASGPDGGEWGVECRDEGLNFWGITFPPVDDSAASSSVLLECEQCHEVALIHFSMVEYDLLDSTGSLPRKCNTCRAETQWTFSRNPTRVPEPSLPLEPEAPAPAPPPVAQAEAASVAPSSSVERRMSPRVALRLPLRVRNSQDVTDLTKSENMSKGGVAFTSDKVFEIQEFLKVTCPYSPSGENIEVLGRVVRREEVAGTGRYLYGVMYSR